MCPLSLSVDMGQLPIALYTHVNATGVHWCPWQRSLQLSDASPVLRSLASCACVFLNNNIINFCLLSVCLLVLVRRLLFDPCNTSTKKKKIDASQKLPTYTHIHVRATVMQ